MDENDSGRSTPRWRTSRRRAASRSTTRPTSTGTTSSSPRCATSSAPVSRSSATSSSSPTGWPARLVDLGWVQELDEANIPNVTANLQRQPPEPGLGPGPEVLRPVAERPDRDRLQREVHRRDRELRGAGHPQGPQGQDRAAQRDGRHHGFVLKLVGADPDDFSDDEWGRGARPDGRDRRVRPGAAVHRQRLRAAAEQRGHRRLRGMVRRHHRHAVRQHRHQVRDAGRGHGPLERQHDGAQQVGAQEERRDPDELLLRPRGRRPPGRVGQLHLPGEGSARRRWRRSTTRSWATR